MSLSAGPGRCCSATEVKISYTVLTLRQGNMLPCLNKRKRGKDREEKTFPTQGWRERLQLNVWVCLVLILLRLEGRRHAPVRPCLCCRQLLVFFMSPSRAQPSEAEERRSYQLLFSCLSLGCCCLPASWFCCQRIISKLGASDTQICWEFYVLLTGFLLVLL